MMVPNMKLPNATAAAVRSTPECGTKMRDEPEAKEDDVAGHVGDKDVAEHQNADCDHQPGGERQQRRSR